MKIAHCLHIILVVGSIQMFSGGISSGGEKGGQVDGIT